MSKSFRRHHKKFTELRRLWRKAKQSSHWWNGRAIQKVSTLGLTTKILLNFNIKCQMKNEVLESKAHQSLRFLTTSSHQSNVKNYKKLWTLIQSCIKKYSSIEVNLDPIQNWSSKIGPPIFSSNFGGPKLELQNRTKTRPKVSKTCPKNLAYNKWIF